MVVKQRKPHLLDSSVGRASAFGAGDRGFESRGRTIPKVYKHGTSSSLANARIKGVVLGSNKAGKYLLKILLCRRIARELMVKRR